LSKEETRKERSIEEDKYIYYRIEPIRSEANDINKREKMGSMMQK